MLSVIIPVFNELNTINQILEKVRAVKIEKEIILVDDFSTDGTRAILKKEEGKQGIKVFYHDHNKGKGAAIRTGIQNVSGDLVVIQDADLEYDPEDYHSLIAPIAEGQADVVYGSRFLGNIESMSLLFKLGNRILSFITTVLYGKTLTDMETCYKVCKSSIIKKIVIRSDRFDFEPEITAKFLKNRYRIMEMPISYKGRGAKEGKKLGCKDGIQAIIALVRFRFSD